MNALARSACIAVLMLLLVGTTSPAVAKGPVEVAVAGPGIDRTLDYYTDSGADVDMGSLGEASRIYDIYGTNRPGPAPGLGKEELGARFVLTWDLGDENVVQHAYPFAEGGAWVRFLRGQEMFGRPVAHGWSRAPGLTDQLLDLGAVDEETESAEVQQPALATVEPEAAPVADGDRPSGGTSYDVAVPAGLVLAGVLGVGALVLWRRRLSR